MKITLKNQQTRKYQVGGSVPSAENTPAGEVSVDQATLQDPIMMLALMSALALQSQDCNMAMQVCLVFLDIVLQMQGNAPAEPQGEPVFRKGGILVRKIKK